MCSPAGGQFGSSLARRMNQAAKSPPKNISSEVSQTITPTISGAVRSRTSETGSVFTTAELTPQFLPRWCSPAYD